MLSHELFHEQVLRDREREMRLGRTAPVRHDRRHGTTPSFVRVLIPAITHGLLRVPAPPRPAGGGC